MKEEKEKQNKEMLTRKVRRKMKRFLIKKATDKNLNAYFKPFKLDLILI